MKMCEDCGSDRVSVEHEASVGYMLKGDVYTCHECGCVWAENDYRVSEEEDD